MHVCYVSLSPTFGMHQYTADLANRWASSPTEQLADSQSRATVLTVKGAPNDRYGPHVKVVNHEVPAAHRWTRPDLRSLRKLYRTVLDVRPDVVHFTSPYVWTPILLLWLRRKGIPTIHTIHDLDPHAGASYGRLLYVWNELIIRLARHILVHGRIYRARLMARGRSPDRVTYAPLLHLFLSYENERRLHRDHQATIAKRGSAGDPRYALFFARLEHYKGVNVLVDAVRQLERTPCASGARLPSSIRAVIAGQGDIHRVVKGTLPDAIEVRNRLIEDEEAIGLFRRCELVVLPYVDATQSALIGAAYLFGKPVIVTRVGALPEYVIEGKTGWVIEPNDSQALAECLGIALDDSPHLVQMGECGRAWYQSQRMLEQETLQRMYVSTAALVGD